MIKFVIPLSPISKKNSQRILINHSTGKPFIAPSKQYKEYEKNAMWFIPKNIYIQTACNVKCLFYMPTKRKCDLTNMLEAIDDIMVKAGLLADDNYTIIQSHDGSRVIVDKENPRTEVYIQEYPLIKLDEANIFDKEEIHENCTVQIWENSVTGECSIGWWENEKHD